MLEWVFANPNRKLRFTLKEFENFYSMLSFEIHSVLKPQVN